MAKKKVIPLSKCMVKEPVPAGMNPFVLMSVAYFYRTSTEHTAPIVVKREGKYYRIMDGRHRYMGSIIAGRTHILAIIEEED